MNFKNNVMHCYPLIISAVLLSVAIMFVSRLVALVYVADFNQIMHHTSDLWRFIITGLRFDFRVATMAFSLLLLTGLLCAMFDKSYQYFLKIARWYSGIIFLLIFGFTLGNYFYYQTYGNHFDVFLFGFFDDDTQAVLDNIWQDYPIILASIGLILVTSVCQILFLRYVNRPVLHQLSSTRWVSVSVVGFVLVYFVLARGSIGTLPLKRYHMNVSEYTVLNKWVPNALMALDWARTDYRDQATFDPVTSEEVTNQMVNMLKQDTAVYHTPENSYLEVHSPHVVMALMESMGMNVLVEDDAKHNDLLGKLRPAFKEDFVFSRFLAGTSATIDSIVMMLFHSNIPTISHSSVANIALPSSAVLPYKKAGYEISFIYGGNGMWRNLSNYLPLQGFDQVYDEISIKKAFPEAKGQETTWGVYDEYVFKFAQKLLMEAQKPQLIYIMTTTNHSPYQVLERYQPTPISVTERLKKNSNLKAEEIPKMLQTYQYASNALGEFIQWTKASDFVDNTIIAASGDHRIRSLKAQLPSEIALENAVPFYLYLPKPILKAVDYRYDPERIGSHRDIFPTLYHFSLSDADYVSLGGQNMLSVNGIDNVGYNQTSTIFAMGAYKNTQSDRFYPWTEDGIHTQVESQSNPMPTFSQDYHQLQDVFLRSQVVNNPSDD